MGVQVKVLFQDKVITALAFFRQMFQVVDSEGKPFGRPTGHLVSLVFESTHLTDEFFRLIVDEIMFDITILFSPVTRNSKSSKLELRDVHVANYKESFKPDSGLIASIVFTAAIVNFNGVIHYEHWKVSDITPPKMAEPTPVPREKKKEILDFYYTDLEGKKDAVFTFGKKANLVLRSKNMIGETVDLKLDKKVIDFVYNGKRIKDDIIKGYTIKSNTDKIPVEVISKEYKED